MSRYQVQVPKSEGVVMFGPSFDASGGAYRISVSSGLTTEVAAATSTAGHVGVLRNSQATSVSNPYLVLVHGAVARWVTTTGATSAQEVGLDMIVARSFSAAYSGGTAATLTTNNAKNRTSYGGVLSDTVQLRIATTGELTAGTQTLDAQAVAKGGDHELAASATVKRAVFECRLDLPPGVRIALAPEEGLVLRNSIAQGTALVARISWDLDISLVRTNDYQQ
jgi:hypothetical protein